MSDFMPPPAGWNTSSHSHTPNTNNSNSANNNTSQLPGLSLPTNVTTQISTAAESLFSSQLASALSTISDSQYFQDSISPSEIRSQLTQHDPSNPTSTPAFLKSIKWLLASISKGRDVSDFFPHVVKLVGSPSLEIRKMVYMYLVHYADHDATCRDLALLSINAFQRGLTDKEQWIRALALRVLTSIRVNDVLQIQILACVSCGSDASPYVRKCAANALGKLYPRCPTGVAAGGEEQREQLVDILRNLLSQETCTMVLSSAMTSFVEMCPGQLELLHGCFRKLCHLLTDMDEWGQIVVMEVLSRYCRKYFRKPLSEEGEKGSAEVIDEQRRVVRRMRGGGTLDASDLGVAPLGLEDGALLGLEATGSTTKPNISIETGGTTSKKPKKRRVVKKGFYSDDEDESTDEEEDSLYKYRQNSPSLANAMRQRDVLGFGNGISGVDDGDVGRRSDPASAVEDTESATLDEDHRLLLKSSLPLLKSRNSGVVMGVCSLHYYCGVASIKIRSAMGKALVRIYHDRREIQFVVLKSIRTLVWECPSAFTPFLNDFFVKAMDPSFTRIIKLDILCALALEPNSIKAVLEELRTYIRHDDKVFVCASVRAVGKIVEMARIVYDRQGVKTQDSRKAREDANLIALNCLHGLLTLTESSESVSIVGECVETMQRIITLLLENSNTIVHDPNDVVSMVMRKILLLLVRSLSADRDEEGEEKQLEEEDFDGTKDKHELSMREQNLLLPTEKVSTALWIVGEWLTSSANTAGALHITDVKNLDKKVIQTELVRLVARAFPDMKSNLKLHSIHFASKVLLSTDSSDDSSLCEYILGMGRVDITPDVRDRARYESQILNMAKGLKSDVENLPKLIKGTTSAITLADAKSMLLQFKPSSSWLPVEKNDEDFRNPFRFGSLSSMFSHKAGDAYMALPSWAAEDSPKSLRDPPQMKKKNKSTGVNGKNRRQERITSSAFYGSSESSSSSDDSSSSSDSSDDDTSDDSSSSSSSDDTSSKSEDDSSEEDDESTDSSDSEDEPTLNTIPAVNARRQILPEMKSKKESLLPSSDDSSDSDDESSSDSSSGSSSSSDSEVAPRENKTGSFSLIDIRTNNKSTDATELSKSNQKSQLDDKSDVSGLASGLEGLVMAPLVVDKGNEDETENSDIETESGNWNILVRSELSGGLSISARFLRGSTRKREAKLLGLDSNNSTVVIAQLKFENRRDDGGVLRRIRLMQKKVQSSNVVATARVVLPQEISLLPVSKVSYAMVGIEFEKASDKDGSMMAKFDAKCDRSSTVLDLQPPLSELLIKSKCNRVDFDAKIKKLGGVHQSAKSSFTLKSNGGESVASQYNKLPAKICKFINISPLKGKMDWFEQCCRFIGHLPASGMDVIVLVKYNQEKGSGEIVVYCDSPVALNCILVAIKTAVNA